MLKHLLSRDHQESYLKDLAKIDVNLINLQEEIEKVKENGKSELITTIYSDELMPWPEGLAPWSVEQGGIGIPPTLQVREFQKLKGFKLLAIFLSPPLLALYNRCPWFFFRGGGQKYPLEC